MNVLEQTLLGFVYAVVFTVVLIEWISGCGTPEGECVVLKHSLPFIIANMGG